MNDMNELTFSKKVVEKTFFFINSSNSTKPVIGQNNLRTMSQMSHAKQTSVVKHTETFNLVSLVLERVNLRK